MKKPKGLQISAQAKPVKRFLPARSIQMSAQAKLFLQSCDDKARDDLLDTIAKIASGELVGELVDVDTLPADVREDLQAAERQIAKGKKSPRA